MTHLHRLKPIALWINRGAVLALATLIASLTPPAMAQWLGTPPFIDSQTRFEAPARSSEREAPFRGRLQHLSDGDSFIVRAEDGRRISVRLSAIDAPEKVQPHGDVSRRALLALLDNKPLTIIPVKQDPYGRTVARVLVDDRDVGLEQVKAGMAWHYKRYESEQSARDRRDYTHAEQRAREAAVGLWAQPDPMPPWKFREQQRRKQQGATDAWLTPKAAGSAAGHAAAA